MAFKKSFLIADRMVGEKAPTFVIAEAGVAHFGSIEKAYQLVDLAKAAKADAIKFQIFHTNEFISSESSDWQERYRSKELVLDDFKKIKTYCDEKQIMFFATGHDECSLKDLEQLEVPVYKIGSGEVKNWPFIKKIAELKKPTIFSTGMYSMEDIKIALRIFEDAGNRDVAVLHCTTAYPTPPDQVNLSAIGTLKGAFDCVVGYSDHTQGYHFPVVAVALGAKIIEKHITLEYNIPDAQDWKVSCGPENLSLMVSQIRDIEIGLGTGVKEPTDLEKKSLEWGRKSLVAFGNIKSGQVITLDMIKIKRPGTGISPSDLNNVVGKQAQKDIKNDSLIKMEDLS